MNDKTWNQRWVGRNNDIQFNFFFNIFSDCFFDIFRLAKKNQMDVVASDQLLFLYVLEC